MLAKANTASAALLESRRRVEKGSELASEAYECVQSIVRNATETEAHLMKIALLRNVETAMHQAKSS